MLAIAFLAVLAYSNTFSVPFLLDDSLNLLENPSIHSLLPLKETLAGSPRTGISGRPVSNLSFALSWALSGDRPWGHHAVNLLIHVLCSLCVLLIMRQALSLPAFAPIFPGRNLFVSFSCALIFSLHPLCIQAVTYITQRIESLMALFFLLTFFFALKGFAGKGKIFWHLASVLCLFLGAGTKEPIVVAPFLVLLFDWRFATRSLGRALRGSPLLYTGYAAGLGFLFWLVLGGGTAELAYAGTEKFSAWQYLAFQPIVLCLYLARSFWPAGLSFDYGWPSDGTFGWPWPAPGQLVFAAAFLLILAMAAIYGLYRRNGLAFGWAWFFAVLTPTSSILPLYCLAAEQRMYLPLAGIVCSVVPGAFAGLRWAARRAGFTEKQNRYARALGFVLLLGLGLALLAATHARNAVFASEKGLWADTFEKLPTNSRAATNLGKAMFYEGQRDRAIELFRLALDIRPDLVVARRDLGLALVDAGRKQEGLAQIEQARKALPDDPAGLYAAGYAWLSLGEAEKAAGFLQRAVAAQPNHAQAHSELGSALLMQNNLPDAARHLRAALDLNPGLVDAHVNLGLIYLAQKKNAPAMEHLTRAVSLAPGHLKARLTYGKALADQGRISEAADQYATAVKIAPDSREALARMGELLVLTQRGDQALDYFQRALSLSFDPRTSMNAGTVLLQQGKAAEALPYFRKSVSARPDYGRGWFNLGLALARTGDAEGARQALLKARSLSPELFTGSGKGE